MSLPAPSRPSADWGPAVAVGRVAPTAGEVAELAAVLGMDGWRLEPASQWGLDGPPALASLRDSLAERMGQPAHTLPSWLLQIVEN